MENRSAGRGFLVLSIASVLTKVLSAVYAPILMNILGKSGYGIYLKGYDVFVFILAVTTFGTQPAITKVVTELRAIGNHRDAYKALKITRTYLVIIGLIFSVLFFIAAKPLAIFTGSEDATLTFMFLAPTIFLAVFSSVYRAYMQAVDDLTSLAISNVLEQLINAVFSIVFAFMLGKISKEVWGSAGGTVGTTLGAIIAILYIFYVSSKKGYKEEAYSHPEPKRKASDNKIIKRLLMYAIPITLVAVVQNAGNVIDAFTVGNSLKALNLSEDKVNGLYGVLGTYKTLIYVPLALITALGTSIYTKVIHAYAVKDKKNLRKQMSYAFRITYIIIIPSVIGLSVLAHEVYAFLVPEMIEGSRLVTWGSIVLLFMAISSIQNVILQGISKYRVIVAASTIGLLMKLLCNFFLIGIPSINIAGAVIGMLISFIIPTVMNHIALQKAFKVKIPIIKQAIVPTISSLVMGVTVLVAKIPLMRICNIMGGGRVLIMVFTLILAGIGGFVYLYIMVYFGGIRRKDLELISPRIYNLLPKFIRRQLI